MEPEIPTPVWTDRPLWKGVITFPQILLRAVITNLRPDTRTDRRVIFLILINFFHWCECYSIVVLNININKHVIYKIYLFHTVHKNVIQKIICVYLDFYWELLFSVREEPRVLDLWTNICCRRMILDCLCTIVSYCRIFRIHTCLRVSCKVFVINVEVSYVWLKPGFCSTQSNGVHFTRKDKSWKRYLSHF